MKKSIFIISILLVQVGIGQIRACLSASMDSMRRLENPGLGTVKDFENWMNKKKVRTSSRSQAIRYRIPVVVHVVYNGEPVGVGPNLSYEQIVSQIEVLNEDFMRMPGTNGFNDNPNGADTEIEFYLAELDPSGSLLDEPGVDRVDGGRNEWPQGIFQNPIESQLKPNTIWDPEQYFNIWTVNFGGFFGRNLLGYAQFPDMSGLEGLDEDEGSAETDGVVIGYKYFGSSEKGNFPDLFSPFDLGRTTTHEVGHWLGLRHIWGDENGCLGDDFVEDTPLVGEATNGCPNVLFSCGFESMFENYMDYTDDRCMNIFTEGQKERMITVLENSPRRTELVEVVLSVENNEKDVLLYPNPARKELNVELGATSDFDALKIIAASGKEITSVQPNPSNHGVYKFNIEFLKSGVYFLQASYLSEPSKGIFLKFIKTP
ncbi:MAG: M43 family zinc metalloprotease [Bacteroidota bacterium]